MRVLVTGISSKIGIALAQELLYQGHGVWGIARTHDFFKEFSKEQKFVDQFSFSLCDVTSSEDVTRVGEEMMRAQFVPDAVVLGAGVTEDDLVPDFNYKVFKRTHATNLCGALAWVDYFLPHFKKRGSGVFVAISSTQIFHPSSTNAGYAASKAALAMAFRNLRVRYAPENIFFTNVYFGPVLTRKNPIKKNFFVREPYKVVPCILRALSGKQAGYYKPFFLKPLLVLSQLFPDRLIVAVLEFLRRE